MTIRILKSMFNPRSIAIIGRDQQENDPAALLGQNLINAGFPGPVLPINPDRRAVAGVLAYRDVASLPETPELAISTLPLTESPALICELGARGTRAVVLLSNERLNGWQDHATLRQSLLAAAKPHGMRILGPNRLGMAIPINHLNATLSHTSLSPGSISVVAQSSTLLRAMLHWAQPRQMGFSHLVSLGDRVDVGFSELLDYLAQDPQTRAILLYLESIRDPRQFMSAARVAARLKPVIALKPRFYGNRSVEESIYDAAARRVGILRVDTIEQLFNAAETLANNRPVRKNRLLILGNSHSMGLLASDRLTREGGTLAPLSAATRDGLAGLIPPGYRVDNPIDLGHHAGFAEYDRALEWLLKEVEADGLLIVHVPTAPDRDRDCGRAIVARAAQSQSPVLVNWVGATPAAPAWQLFQAAQIPTYATPEEAVWSFLQLAEYRRTQELLMETPPSIPEEFTPATAAARRVIAAALAAGRDELNLQATREVLAAYQIPMVTTRFAPTPEAAAVLAMELGGNVALKILSPDIDNRSAMGGVALGLEGPQEVLTAAAALWRRVQTLLPEAVLEGFAVQPMVPRRDAFEVALGVRTGREFKAGPVLFFGHGGTETPVINDLAYALPPLNLHLAQDLIARTRLYSLLCNCPGRPVNLDALALTVVKVSQLVVDLGELVEMDINPLRVDAEGVLALSARIRIAPATGPAQDRLAIRPYPKELEQRLTLPNGRTLYLRPILPEDEPALQALIQRMPPEDVYRRFFRPLKQLTHDLAARLTQLDYDREMALVVTGPGVAGQADIWGVVSLMSSDSDLDKAEYAIIVDRALGYQGLGSRLMREIIAYARQHGIAEVVGDVLEENEAMLRINQALGFMIESDLDDPDVMHVSLPLWRERAVNPTSRVKLPEGVRISQLV